ncbi:MULTISPECIES: nitronate monooxygenase family protein [unclassified Caulobacter]|uniref:NAD(P)H-dependent flavin oxidoreductase n=1 Tax=unclassified Caulobacter TaxID=2648921 RepID=UPI0006FB374C|nr:MULTISPECIES: nitronate monooxygenase family protein [unclassified Caulobacter]KQV55272.1 2-nitropropane dioxygenase [Caulobacter sp. Root342]KQV63539.1 2-nitropropane dioxygenase [Caulobacter sp. Root343]
MVSSHRLLDLLGVELPIIQAPMAGATSPQMVIAVSNAGGLGSLPSSLYSEAELRAALDAVRAGTSRPINVNFVSHEPPPEDPARQATWRRALAPYYVEAGLDPDQPISGAGRAPFDEAFAGVVEDYRPEVVSFHFGLPAPALVDRVKRTGAKLLSSATTVAEARWLEARGVDAVIAMGFEAGGHRGNFLDHDMNSQVGTFALVPRIVDAVSVPVIAAGGITDRRGVEAAFALGAQAAQVGTAYLLTPEASISAVYRQALASAEEVTAVTNLFTGRPARGIVNRLMAELGPLSDLVPAFPTAGAAVAPLRKAAEAAGRGDFSPLWAGQGFRLAQPMPAADLTRRLAGVG